MTLTHTQKMVLTGIGVGIAVGLIVGAVGALLNLSPGVRGGLTGGFVVLALGWLNRRMRESRDPEQV
ncbi:MAG TPA: hypothetical protein VFZ73_02485 [Gemmatimonadaceae bacterium]